MSRTAPAKRLLCLALLGTALTSCSLFGGPPPASSGTALPAPSDQETIDLARRTARFYHALEGVPIDALTTFESRELRGYFRMPGQWSDYYSSLATAMRHEALRAGTATEVSVGELRFEGADRAFAEVRYSGRHERALRFWTIGFARTDRWLLVDGTWYLDPEKL